MTKASYVVAVGDPFRGGVRLFGPFDTADAAQAWAKHWVFRYYDVVPLTPALAIHKPLTDNQEARAITRARHPPKENKP